MGPENTSRVTAVLFDRDGTLIEDVPYNGDPRRVRPVPTAASALARLRRKGIRVGVITNQSGVARGLVTADQVARVNAQVEALLGPFDTWQVCPHGPADGCACRKPAPGMVLAACAALKVPAEQVVMVGDIESDMVAARDAGVRSVLVPTPVTRVEEIHRAPVTACDLAAAVDWALTWEMSEALT
ncbi:HAD-IIIA family hydrolase [Kibdelosporangium persicum]|uniref:D,D-heptose 1,7-bisphosphate phosphatase n=1 Tax=Kibdelosporangium persicum TaxID=2698649 RepID=A0ABX2F8N0_9PSEU|nr:HAD family hydrolase [Kibdelosporangium persicum]NRN67563.1 Haloacid dehalogenase [Kibdelosporangium persicum]